MKNENYKVIPGLMYLYWMNECIISCIWKHAENACMSSDEYNFLFVNGLTIKNDRSETDIVFLRNICF